MKKSGLFGRTDTADEIGEERIIGPWKMVLKNFCSNKAAMSAFILFALIFLGVIIGPRFFPLDLSYQESSQINMAPGRNLMKLPEELKGNVLMLSVGPKFSAGVSGDGRVSVWGQTGISRTIDVGEIPEITGPAVLTAAGFDHILALEEDGTVYAWGSNRLGQCTLPGDLYDEGRIVQLAAGYQISAAVTDTGYVHLWGNTSLNDARIKRDLQGGIAKVVFTSDAMLGLTKDGSVVYLGRNATSYSKIPDAVNNAKTVDLAASAAAVAALLEDGSVLVWGNLSNGLADVPETAGKIVKLAAGRYHFTAVTDQNEVIAWGQNSLGQTDVPESLDAGREKPETPASGQTVKAVYSGYYQNYAVMDDGSVVSWGLKGYVLGTDELGRDILNRMVNGGLMTMTIGAVAVVISTVLGVVIGCISGFFGGKTDMILMRITELFSSIPFLPFAMILSSIMVTKFGENMRIFIIMVILGLLSWSGLARLVRAQVLSKREQEFVTAARAMGIKEAAIVFRHILPNVVSTIIVNATLSFATCLLTESSLSFLGFGVARPRPTWGNMLFGANNSVTIQNYWWQWVFTALALSVCVICINTIGDGLRDALDPKSNER